MNQIVRANISRNSFLKIGIGILGLASLSRILNSCKSDPIIGGSGYTSNGYGFGSGDIALLNYLYVIEQVQAAFYLKWVNALKTSNPSLFYLGHLGDIALHQATHCAFFNNALGTNAIPILNLDFSGIDFTNASQLLILGQKFQETELGAYLGISSSFQSSAFLTLSQQISSVEARHTSYLTGLNQTNSFMNSALLNAGGYENSLNPSTVFSFYKSYIKTPLDLTSLPTG